MIAKGGFPTYLRPRPSPGGFPGGLWTISVGTSLMVHMVDFIFRIRFCKIKALKFLLNKTHVVFLPFLIHPPLEKFIFDDYTLILRAHIKTMQIHINKL